MLRDITGVGSNRTEIGPQLALSMAGEGHRLSASYELLARNNHDSGTTNLLTHNLGLSYQYRMGRHRFGGEAAYRGRHPEAAGSTNAFKLGVFWSIDFQRPARAPAGPPPIGIAALAAAPGAPLDLAAIGPRLRMAEAEDILRGAGITGGSYRPGMVVYETSVIEIITERQRLVIEHDRGQVLSTAVIIDIDDPSDAPGLARTFERAREYLLGRYGAPTRTLEDGEFTAALADDLASGRFVRVAEWETPSGVLRLGIPRRLDRVVRIEIRHARDLPGPREGLWGLETIR